MSLLKLLFSICIWGLTAGQMDYPDPRIVIVGPTGSGKSSLANALLGCDPRGDSCIFPVCEGMDSCTKETSIGFGPWLGTGENFTVVDTPGFGDSDGQDNKLIEEMIKVLDGDLGYTNIILLLFDGNTARFTTGLQVMLRQMSSLFGEAWWNNIIIGVSKWKFSQSAIDEREGDCEYYGEESKKCKNEARFMRDISGQLNDKFNLDKNFTFTFAHSHSQSGRALNDEVQQMHFQAQAKIIWDAATTGDTEFDFKTIDDVLEENQLLKKKNRKLNFLFETHIDTIYSLVRENEQRINGNGEIIDNNIEKIKANITTLLSLVEENDQRMDEHAAKINSSMELTNVMEEELKNTADLLKVTVLRSCAEYGHYGLKTSGRYMIDPDGKLIGKEPFQVYCDFSSGATEVMHDTEVVTEIQQCHDPGCFRKKISYINGLTSEPISMNQVLSLMELSEYCEQDIRIDCTQAPLQHNGVNYAWWKDRHGEENFYFTGNHHNQHVCDCHYSADGCANSKFEQNTCNCDAYLPIPAFDTGTITNMSSLPIMEMYAGGLDFEIEVGAFQIGRLKCYGETNVETATSCSSLKKKGVVVSGYYNIKPMEAKQAKLVFCDMKSDTYTDVPQIEQADDSPLGTISAWISKPSEASSQLQIPNGWVLCDGTIIEKGIWAGTRTPDLNNGHFLRGGSIHHQLQMEEDQLQDHHHNDPGHSHAASSSSSSSHSHGYQDYRIWGGDGDYPKYCYDGQCTDKDGPTPESRTTNSASVSISTSTSVRSHTTGVSGISSSYKYGAETRPKNMRVSWIIKCW